MKKIFKLFTVLMALFMLMGLTGCIAIIGDTTDPENMDIDTAEKFETFMSNGSSIGKLTADFEVSTTSVIPEGKEKTLNLNGKTVTYTANASGAVVKVIGTLTIMDDSTSTLEDQGKLANTFNNGAAYAVYVDRGGTVTINAGQYEVVGGANGLGVLGTATVTKALFLGGTGVCVATGGLVESLKCDVSAEEYAVFNNGRIKLISNLDAGYEVRSATYNLVAGLVNDGTIDEIKNATFSATGTVSATKELFGLINESSGTIGSFYNTIFDATNDSGNHDHCYNITRNTTNAQAVPTTGVTFSPALEDD